MHREHEDLALASGLAQLTRGIDTRELRHIDVHEHNVRTLFHYEGDCFVTVSGFADYGEIFSRLQ